MSQIVPFASQSTHAYYSRESSNENARGDFRLRYDLLEFLCFPWYNNDINFFLNRELFLIQNRFTERFAQQIGIIAFC